jgi:MarR family transcriptional regulator, lower aerobic nicotinate degradation pathway regulator
VPTAHPDSDRAPARIKDRPTWLISRASARSAGLLNAAFENHGEGLRGYHYRLLAALEDIGPMSQADLGRSTGIDRSDVTAALADLEARALVERSVDPDNKRRKIVVITRPGRKKLLDLDKVVDGVQVALLAPLTTAQRRQFLAVMHRLLDDALSGKESAGQ